MPITEPDPAAELTGAISAITFARLLVRRGIEVTISGHKVKAVMKSASEDPALIDGGIMGGREVKILVPRAFEPRKGMRYKDPESGKTLTLFNWTTRSAYHALSFQEQS